MPKNESKEDLEKFKEKYKKLEREFKLPKFEELNADFSIEKIADVETDHHLREICRIMSDKFSAFFRFVEMLLNPVNSPIFIFSIIKTIGEDEKKSLSQIYKELARIELDVIELDINFSEKKQADFINNSFAKWQSIKGDFTKIIEKIKVNWDLKGEGKTNGYFG